MRAEIDRRPEIGSIWNVRSTRRTGANAETELALLTRAFEELASTAVQFRTDWLNRRSRAVIARLGAKQDGFPRGHAVLAEGSLSDTVACSIRAPERPAVRAQLRRRLAAHR